MKTLKDLITELDIKADEKYTDDARTMCLSRRATFDEESLGITCVHAYPIVTECKDVVGFLRYVQGWCYLMSKASTFVQWCALENKNDDSIKALDEYKKWIRHVQELRRFFGDAHYYEFLVAV